MWPCNFPKYVALTEEVDWNVIFIILEVCYSKHFDRTIFKPQKAKRRCKALTKYVSSTLLSEESKKHFTSALILDMMSSEDKQEDENGDQYFVIRKPKFRTRKFEKLLKTIDDPYKGNCSQLAKDQTVGREIVEESERRKPKLSDENLSKLFIP